MSQRALSFIDKLICGVDRALRTTVPGTSTAKRQRPTPSQTPENTLNEKESRHSAGLMRVNHTGEVCAQALYQGQALTARLPRVRQEMEQAADEEIDHLAWCEQRLKELDSHTSVLNPVWYGLSFGLGAAAGWASDKISLGFVAATEEQVCKHLRDHLERLPDDDLASRAIVQQMLTDEARHAHTALQAGGHDFPAPVKTAMSAVSRLMTSTSYRI